MINLSTPLDLPQYLARIRYYGSVSPTLGVLQELQKFHLLHVPFENLDIYLGRPIALENTYDKVVLQGRGGFCYELNSIFYTLLQEIGFTVQLISARVYSAFSGYGQEFDHMAIIANIDDVEYLVDVGFGEFAFTPLRIEIGLVQKDPRGEFRVDTEDGHIYVVQKKVNDGFAPQYTFTKNPRVLSDFLEMCHYHQTSPDSHFTQKRMCSMPTEHGRVSISGNILKITEGNTIREIPLTTEKDFENALRDYFGIQL